MGGPTQWEVNPGEVARRGEMVGHPVEEECGLVVAGPSGDDCVKLLLQPQDGYVQPQLVHLVTQDGAIQTWKQTGQYCKIGNFGSFSFKFILEAMRAVYDGILRAFPTSL